MTRRAWLRCWTRRGTDVSVNVLCSYAFHAETDLARVRANLVCGRLMVDSGAFTAHSTGKPITLDDYARYLERWQHCWDHAITLDVIGDSAATAANTRKLHERGIPVMPVFTRGGRLADFDAMVRDTPYVCVGGLVGLPARAQRERVAMLQRRAADSGGGIHALGVGSLDNLRACRPYSADASGISGAYMYGSIAYFNGRRIVCTSISDRDRLRRDWKHIRAHGIELGSLVRTRRMPDEASGGRARLMRAMSIAYAAADEQIKGTSAVTPPDGLDDDHGPHLYSSMGRVSDAYYGSEGDVTLHRTDEPAPDIWRIYGAHHQCRDHQAHIPEETDDRVTVAP